MPKIVDLKNKVRSLEAQDAPMPVRMDAIADVNKEWKNIKEKEINRVLGEAAYEAGHEIHHAARDRVSYTFSKIEYDDGFFSKRHGFRDNG